MKYKKPKFWDFKKPNLLSYLLLPLTLPVRLNNLLLKFKSKKKNTQIKSICVGNIYLGGTGKTPATIKLYEICKKLKLNILTAKKYYKSQLDEQIILKEKTNFITDRSRKKIFKKAADNKAQVIIFDDGLQDISVNYDLQIVCFDSESWIGNGCLMPSGPLRENINSLVKYDAVFLKDEDTDTQNIVSLIKNQNSQIKIFKTYYEPVNLVDFDINENYLIFSGIGNPINFKKILIQNKLNVLEEIIYPDHYQYTKNDITKIKAKSKELGAKIITTEKDYVKLSNSDRENINYLKLKLVVDNEIELTNFIKSKLYEKY